MSAESQEKQQQLQQLQSSTSQLWQGFVGSVGGGIGIDTSTTTAPAAAVTDATLLGATTAVQSQNNNNNYVNFNQFIMQHNFLGGNGVTNNAQQHNGLDGAVGDDLFSNINSFNDLDNYQQATTNLFGNNTSSSSQLFPYSFDNDLSTFYNLNGTGGGGGDGIAGSSGDRANDSGYNNLTVEAATTNNHFYDNLYTPFGTSGGTTYYANPFATGFDFGTTVTGNSQLHATAPEFVPRFNNLTINDASGGSVVDFVTELKAHSGGGGGSEKLEQLKNNFNNSSSNSLESAFAAYDFNNSSKTAVSTVPVADNLIELEKEESKSKVNECNNDNTDFIINNSAQPIATPAAQSASQTTRSTGATSKQFGSNNQNNTNSNIINSNNFNNNNNQRSDSRGASNGFATANTAPLTQIIPEKPMQITQTSQSQSQPMAVNKRYPFTKNGRRSMDYHEREREDRYERSERGSNSHGQRGSNQRDRDRYDNHRSNKRRDDWNRNRDRINGYRVEEKYSSDNGKDSPLPSPEKKSPKKIYPENEKLSQREKLIRDIETRRLECLVCVEPIKAHNSVWSCHNCYHILHLQCIIKWASSSKSDDGWRCPACQNVVKDVPRDYYCFCGKLKNPQYTRQDIAHSCGEVCGRVEGCAHACTLLCHPGPCPPCQANVRRECGCGKTTKIMQCCLKEPIECDSTCGKLLNCELHTCAEKCHAGKCPACADKVDQRCHCSKQERQVACTRDSHDKTTYSCGKPCGRDLSCGNHKCKDCCHAGECRPCKLSPDQVTSCPCGKMPVVQGQRKSCLDTIPVCEGVCGKTLRCGKAAHPHHCTSKCHLGNCPPCNKQTAVKCRCGHMDQMIKCRQLSTRADDARCKKRCVKKRSCGKHKCNQECCIDIDHICPLPCNYTLSCGKHKCDQPCHRGNCPPCYRSSFEELYCECGAEVIYPPVPCGTKRPICKRPCSRTHPCDHTPQHNCHSATSCPPCMMFTTKWCYGQHEQRKTIPCSQESFSCGLACNKPLPCGRHKCIRSCHEGQCQLTQGEICKQNCTALRATCGHKCMSQCHEGECPETPCKEMVEVQCECGNRKQLRSCHDLAREYSRIATAQLASSMAEMQRGNYMELSEILAPVKANKTNKTLDCNDECRLLERNRRLAIGLQIRNPDLPQKLLTKYSDFIRNFAKRDPILVKSIHDSLTTLVKLAKESKQKSRSHSFPTMNREKRQLVHEMCEMFGVDSVAYDAEPNRNVVATAHKDRSWLPATSIMEVIQRETGQRRVPVPSNNAWGIKR